MSLAGPNYAATPNVGTCVVTAADASRTAPASTQTLYTAGASGSRIDRIVGNLLGSAAQTVARLFLYNALTSGYTLYVESQIATTTSSGTVQMSPIMQINSTTTPELMPIIIPVNYQLRVSLNDAIASGVAFTAFGGNF